MSNILLIAPDSDLRTSLEFVLGAEGHRVLWGASIASRHLPRSFDCTVLDHHAVGKNLEEGLAFCEAFRPVVLLANAAGHPLTPCVFATVLKPILGISSAKTIRHLLRMPKGPQVISQTTFPIVATRSA